MHRIELDIQKLKQEKLKSPASPWACLFTGLTIVCGLRSEHKLDLDKFFDICVEAKAIRGYKENSPEEKSVIAKYHGATQSEDDAC